VCVCVFQYKFTSMKKGEKSSSAAVIRIIQWRREQYERERESSISLYDISLMAHKHVHTHTHTHTKVTHTHTPTHTNPSNTRLIIPSRMVMMCRKTITSRFVAEVTMWTVLKHWRNVHKSNQRITEQQHLNLRYVSRTHTHV